MLITPKINVGVTQLQKSEMYTYSLLLGTDNCACSICFYILLLYFVIFRLQSETTIQTMKACLPLSKWLMPRTIKKVLREEEIAAPANTSRKRGDKNALGWTADTSGGETRNLKIYLIKQYRIYMIDDGKMVALFFFFFFLVVVLVLYARNSSSYILAY